MAPAELCIDREALVLTHRRLARHLAQRYVRRSDQREDLEQAAYLGLVKAANRFDPDRGVEFAAFAVPTILGEVRRLCRDTRWATHVPRPVQERVRRLRQLEDEHQTVHGRSPHVSEAAAALGWTEEEVLDARMAAASLRPESLNAPVQGADGAVGEAIDAVGDEDAGFASAEQRYELQRALGQLTPGERHALRLRGEFGCSVPEIAHNMGLSRSQASRLVLRATQALRRSLDDRPPAPRTPRPEPAPPLLEGMAPETVRQLLAHRSTLSEGPWPGPPADGSFGRLIVSGALLRTVTVGGRSHGELLGPGDLICDGNDDTVSWQVVQPTELAALDASVCRWPAAVSALLQHTSERSRALAAQLALTDLRRADDRVLQLFGTLTERWGRPVPGGAIVALALTHDMIATLVGTHRPAVTSALRRLERQGRVCRVARGSWRVQLAGEPTACAA